MTTPEPTAPKAPKATPYLTVIPYRRPEQKAHVSLAHAKSAISVKVNYRGAYGDMWLYEQIDGEWVLKYTVPRGTTRDELPWKKGDD